MGTLKQKKLGDTYRDDINNSPVVGLSGGYRLCDKLSLGLNFSYRGNYKLDSTRVVAGDLVREEQKFEIASLMATANYNFYQYNNTIFPFVEIGIGGSRIKTGDFRSYDTGAEIYAGGKKNNFTYALRLGNKFRIDKNLDFSVAYQYINFGKFNKSVVDGEVQTGTIKANELLMGLTFKF